LSMGANIVAAGVCVPIEAQRLVPSAQRNLGKTASLFGNRIDADGSDMRR